MPNPALEIAELGRFYTPGHWVLHQLSMRIEQGECVALVGESGVGKSTLLNLIAGLDRPDQGTVRIADGDQMVRIDHLDPDASAHLRGRLLGFVFQAFHLISHLDIAQNVALPALLAGQSARDARAQAMQLLDRLGLGGRPRAFPGELSGGEQQRVALARAVVHRPRLILADEPTGNLDPRTAGLALQLLREIADSVGAAILMVTHSAPAAAQADRVLRLEPDRLLELNRTQGQWAP